MTRERTTSIAESLARWTPGPLRRAVRRRIDRIVALHTGMVPYSQLSSQDIFICGYPKSGNTWFQNLVCGMVYGADARWLPDSLVNEMCPDMHDGLYYRRYATPMYFKAHSPPRPEFRRVVHLLRDGRDVMVSYQHHLSALAGKPIDLLQTIKTGHGTDGKWHEHTQAWLANPHGATILRVRYEDLLADGVKEMKRFCEFAGLQRDDEFLRRAVQQSSFESMRNKETTQGWDNPAWPKDQFFVRRGKVGSYKDEMPADVLAAFMAEAGPTLTRCGYE